MVRTANDYIHEFVLTVFKTPTERDKQISIGASNASQLCDRCLADDMLGIRHPPSKWWAGAVVGTAIHEYAENRLLTNTTIREKYPNVHPEFKMVIGHIDGYGDVTSTSDIYFEDIQGVGDYKTTTKKDFKGICDALDKVATPYDSTQMLKYRYKITTYMNQLMLYGLGYENAGYDVKTVTLVFICRDASGDDDFRVHSVPYDRERALKVFDRAKRLWKWLETHSPEELDSHELCWYCSNMR